MSTTLRIDSFDESNIAERGELTADYVAEALTIELRTTEGFEVGATIYVGQLSREGVEKAVIAAVVDETTITLSEALKLPHAAYEPVTAVLGDSIQIHRAANVDGTVPADESFTVLATRSIDADQLSTYYRDSTGSSSYWYRFNYYNALTLAKTEPTEAFRGADFNHYASLADIRNEAGFKNAYNLADSDVEQQRFIAETEINASLSGAYTVPFSPVPAIVETLTIQLAAAFLLINWIGETSTNKQKLKDARAAIDAYRTRDSVLTDDEGNALSTSQSVSGYPGDPSADAPRFFRMADKF